MTTVITREFTYADLEEARSMKLRANDIKELMAIRPAVDMPEIIEEALESDVCYVIEIDGQIEGLFGCTPHSVHEEFGVIWAFGTPATYEAMDELNVTAKGFIDQWLIEYPYGLGNIMSIENNPSVGWIERLGFKFIDVPFKLSGVTFQAFHKRLADV